MTEYHKIETLYDRSPITFKVDVGKFRGGKCGGFPLIKVWELTEKINGTNIRCIWDPINCLIFGGRTDAAQMSVKLMTHLQKTVRVARLMKIFPDTSVILYGEGYGAGIQKGGVYSQTQKLVLYDILVDGKWWLSRANVEDVAAKLSLPVVPYLGLFNTEDATELVRTGFISKLRDPDGGGGPAEGIVGRPEEALFDKKGARIIWKLKTKDFASNLIYGARRSKNEVDTAR